MSISITNAQASALSLFMPGESDLVQASTYGSVTAWPTDDDSARSGIFYIFVAKDGSGKIVYNRGDHALTTPERRFSRDDVRNAIYDREREARAGL